MLHVLQNLKDVRKRNLGIISDGESVWNIDKPVYRVSLKREPKYFSLPRSFVFREEGHFEEIQGYQ